MLFIGICGASGSGKSTLAEELMQKVGVSGVIINQDAYYQDHPDLSFEERCLLNYDEPSVFDHDLLYQDICTLLQGKPINRKNYDFSAHRRADTEESVEPAELVIVEGIHAFFDPRLMEKMFLRIYIDVEPDICLLRRISRDMNERGRQIDNISRQYLTTVKPMYEKYIRNYKRDADVIVMEGGLNARIVSILTGYLQNELEKSRR